MPYILDIAENEGFLRVETESKDVFDVAFAHSNSLVKSQVVFVEVLLIICDLNNKRDIESLL
jgi:hypothetical protein